MGKMRLVTVRPPTYGASTSTTVSNRHAQPVQTLALTGRSVVYAVSVNCLYRDRVRDRVRVGVRVRDRVRLMVMVRVRHPDSSGNLLIRRKMDYAPLFLSNGPVQ